MKQIDTLQKKNRNKYLILDSTDKNKKVLKKYKELCDGIKNSIENVNKQTLKLHNMTIIIRSVFEEHGKFYPQVYLDECLYEL